MNLLDSDFSSTRLTKFKIDNVIQKCAIKLSHDPFDFTINFITVFMEVGNIKGSFSFFNDLEYCLLQMLNRNGINIKHDEIKKRSSLNSTVFTFHVDTKCEGVLQNNYVLYANRFFDNSILKNFRISPNSIFLKRIYDLNELIEIIFIDYKMIESPLNNKRFCDVSLFYKDHVINDTNEIY